MISIPARPLVTLLLMAGLCAANGAERAAGDSQSARYRQWIEQMKEAERGPFRRIRWFCTDGTVLPPKAPARA